jgi:hypothetical protein
MLRRGKSPGKSRGNSRVKSRGKSPDKSRDKRFDQSPTAKMRARYADQSARIALSGSIQNAHTADPATRSAAATMKGASQLPPWAR